MGSTRCRFALWRTTTIGMKNKSYEPYSPTRKENAQILIPGQAFAPVELEAALDINVIKIIAKYFIVR
jgi:hypothetical protein